jgi:hypothetical protein
MPASWRICCFDAARARVGHDVDRVEVAPDLSSSSISPNIASAIFSVTSDQIGDDLVVALAVGDRAFEILRLRP